MSPSSIARRFPFRVVCATVFGLILLAWFLPNLGFTIRQVLSLTTGDPGLVPNLASSSTKAVTVTLSTPDVRDVDKVIPANHSITFRAPATFIRGYSTCSKASGNQALTFAFWSRTLDPVGPTYVEQRQVCKAPAATRESCPDGPYWRRLDAGEWEVEVQVWNVVTTPAQQHRQFVGQLERARTSNQFCRVYEDAELGMTVVTIPKEDFPAPDVRYDGFPRFCGGVYPLQGEVTAWRGEVARYAPPSIFYKFDQDGKLLFRVTCSRYERGRSSHCTVGFGYGSWFGRIEIPSHGISDSTKAHHDAVDLLNRYLISRTIE